MTTEINPRKLTLQILCDVERGKFAEDLLDDAAEALGAAKADFRLTHELVYGIVRMRLLLDTIIGKFSRIKVSKLEKHMHQALRIGLYQMLFLDRVPQSAAVDESVKLVTKADDKRSANYCNAVLRSVARAFKKIEKAPVAAPDETKSFPVSDDMLVVFDRKIFTALEDDPIAHISQRFSHPPALTTRWLLRYGVKGVKPVCIADNSHPPLHVRINRLRGTIGEVADALTTAGIPYEMVSADILRLLDPEGLRSEVFKHGMFTVQNATSAEATPLLGLKPGETILDMCAAPGGKTTHIAELMGDKGTIIAVDTRKDALAALKDNCTRLGIKSVEAVAGDAVKYAEKNKKKFDRVMLDVPCTNTGVLARRVEARWRFSEKALAELVEKQKALLDAAAKAVKPGGVVVYSTCSIEPEENAQMIDAFLAEHDNFRRDGQREFLQGRDLGDGGYLARLTRLK
jgi:16S rRNA (cytosine967-C5)-methyltransferase